MATSQRLSKPHINLPKKLSANKYKSLMKAGLYGPEDFPGGTMVKTLPVIQDTWVWSFHQEDPLEKEMVSTSEFLVGESRGQRNLVGSNGSHGSQNRARNKDGMREPFWVILNSFHIWEPLRLHELPENRFLQSSKDYPRSLSPSNPVLDLTQHCKYRNVKQW